MELAKTTPEQRAEIYDDVKSLIVPGFLSHSFSIGTARFVLRTIDRSDWTILEYRTHGLTEKEWRSWCIATSIWMVNGSLMFDEEEGTYRLYEAISELPRAVVDTLYSVLNGLMRRVIAAGDVVEGELEFLLPPKTVGDYWGKDSEFEDRLQSYGTNAWQAVHDEYRYNTQLSVTVHQGTLLRQYPIEILASANNGDILADFTVNGGGIGHIPILLKGVCKGYALQAQRSVNGIWVSLESVDINQNNYYQGYQNARGTMDCVFNIDRPSTDLTKPWHIRIFGHKTVIAGNKE